MSTMLLCGPTLYKEQCEQYSVKPNQTILQQLQRIDLMYLTRVDASKTFLGSIGVQALLGFVEAHRGVEELNLEKNGLDQICIEKLCQILLEGHPRLHSITLSKNFLSEGSARLLWNTVRRNPIIVSLKLDGCNVSEQWMQRLTYALGVNASRLEGGGKSGSSLVPVKNDVRNTLSLNFGPLSDGPCWTELSILVISSSESYVKLFHDSVLLPLRSYFSCFHLRVTPAVVTSSDGLALVDTKVDMCRDADNGNLPWCVSFFDPSHPFSPAHLYALKKVLEVLPEKAETILDPQHHSDKRNKIAEKAAVKHQANIFFYAIFSTALSKSFQEQRFFDSDQLCRCMEIDKGEKYNRSSFFTSSGIPILRNATHFAVRCQSDLYVEMTSAHFPNIERHSCQSSYKKEYPEDVLEQWKLISTGHEKVIQTLLTYLTDNITMETGNEGFSVPMILYGEEGIGEDDILSCIARCLTESKEDQKVLRENDGSEKGGATSLLSLSVPRVVTYDVQAHSDSLVSLLYFALSVFNPSASLEYETVDVLCAAVREAIANYREEQPLVLLVSNLGAVRWNPFYAVDMRTAGTSNASCGYFEWIPSSFPPKVRIIVTLHTGHPARIALTQYYPRPKECLCTPLSGRCLIDLLKNFLLNHFNIKLPGLHTLTSTLRDRFTSAELIYLEKSDHIQVKFAELAAACLACTIYGRGDESDVSDEDETISLLRQLPGTMEGVVKQICADLSTLYSPITVLYTSICLCISPLPQSDLLYICEELGGCPKHVTSAVLKEMITFRLVRTDPTSCLSTIAHSSIRHALLDLYDDHVKSISVLVEQHLHRLVATLSPEIFWAFRSLAPIQLSNGNFKSLESLLQNSVVMDSILSSSPLNRVAVINAFFNLQCAQQMLVDMVDLGYSTDGDLYAINERDVTAGLQHVQRYRYHFLQEIMLAEGSSTLIQDARKNAQFANYPVMRAINNGAEDTSRDELQCDNTCLFCDYREDYVAAVTLTSVMVFSMKKKGNCIAHRNICIENEEEGGEVLGICIAAQMKAVVIRKTAIFFLDFSTGTAWTMKGIRAPVEDTAAILNSNGRLLLLHQGCIEGASSRIEVLNLSTRNSEFKITQSVLPSSRAIFCGDYVLHIVQKHIYVLNAQLKEVGVLEHNGVVRSACGVESRRILISSVGSYFWVWNFNGAFVSRVDTGLHPILALTLDSVGSLVITRHAKGLRLWNVASGSCIAPLLTSARGKTSTPRFTCDSRRILATTGSMLNIWDSQSGISIGAIASPSGSFTSFSEKNNLVYTTSVSSKMIKIWDLSEERAVQSENKVLEGTLTTQLLRNGKVSKHSIESVSTDLENDYVVCLDSKGHLFVYSITSGEEIKTNLGTPVYSAFMLKNSTIVFTMINSAQVMYYNILTQCTTSYPLSKFIAHAETLKLLFSPFNRDIFAVSVSNGTNALFVCEMSKSPSTFVNLYYHRGQVFSALFFGNFMYSIGAEDKYVCLWSIEKRVCRTAYQHPVSIECASCTASGILIFMDGNGDVYHLHPEDVTSPSRAQLISSKLSNLCPTLDYFFRNVQLKSILCWSSIIFCVTHFNEVAIIALEKGVVNRVPIQRGITSIRAVENNDQKKIIIGTVTGECLIFDLLFPRSEPGNFLSAGKSLAFRSEHN